MSSGQGSRPEDPTGDTSPADDPDSDALDWTSWRDGPGYSTPVPPSPEGEEPARRGSHARPGDPDSYRHDPPFADPDSDTGPLPVGGSTGATAATEGTSSTSEPRAPAEHISHEEPDPGSRHRAYEALRRYQPEPSTGEPTHETATHDPAGEPAYEPADLYGAPETHGSYGDAPADEPYNYNYDYDDYFSDSQPDPGPDAHRSGYSAEGPSAYDEPTPYAGPADHEEPEEHSYDEPTYPSDEGYPQAPPAPEAPEYGPLGRYSPSIYGDDPAESDAGPAQDPQETSATGGADYDDFWRESGRPGGGVHASRSGTPKTSAPKTKPGKSVTPRMPAETAAGDRTSRRRRRSVPIAGIAAIIVVVVVAAAAYLVFGRSKPHHTTAGSTPKASSAPPSQTAPSSPAPQPTRAQTGASGRLGVPSSIGSLLLNSSLSGKYVGPSVRQEDANSFFIPSRDVVSGFYTADPTATSFSAREPRLMFLVAYLDGSGNAQKELHEFLTNKTFYGQKQISAGKMGGVAACGWLSQQPSSVAHCMWADADSYADFYAWSSNPSSLAHTMITTRPMVELKH